MVRLLIIVFLCGYSLLSCESKKEEVKKEIPEWTQEHSVGMNKQFDREEEIRIKLYLKQHQSWQALTSSTGLRYWIYEKNENPRVKEGDLVELNYEIRLLDETVLYKNDENEVAHFKVDKADVESGLMEGVKYMGEGEKAKFILPSRMAHGLLGDMDKIPPLEVLVIDVELVKVN